MVVTDGIVFQHQDIRNNYADQLLITPPGVPIQ